MVDMSMREQNKGNVSGIEWKRIALIDVLIAALEHSAIDKKPDIGAFDQIA